VHGPADRTWQIEIGGISVEGTKTIRIQGMQKGQGVAALPGVSEKRPVGPMMEMGRM
jgi:hypothetical protein